MPNFLHILYAYIICISSPTLASWPQGEEGPGNQSWARRPCHSVDPIKKRFNHITQLYGPTLASYDSGEEGIGLQLSKYLAEKPSTCKRMGVCVGGGMQVGVGGWVCVWGGSDI